MRQTNSGARWVSRWWGGELGWAGVLLSLATAPLEGLYRAGVGMRNALYASGLRPSESASIPVVSIGNLTVGGSGKTPFAAWCTHWLSERGARPALVTRGYGRDEVELHRRWNPSVPVICDAKRTRGTESAATEGADCVVVDDGFQHRALQRDLDVVLVAAELGIQGRCLPRGPFRESAAALQRADVVIVTRKQASGAKVERVWAEVARRAPQALRGIVEFEGAEWVALDLCGPIDPPDVRAGGLVVCSVARPEGVRALAAGALGVDPTSIDLRSLPDHHEYTRDDVHALVREAAGRPVITTEKDAVKLAAFVHELPSERVHVLRLKMQWTRGEADFTARLAHIARIQP